ncbi:MAG: carbohydrate kinase family protein [Candidatus Thermoplasmatota archaeon]|jgi:ribokinase|nr:carbohydrate kinase family protein [Candidatus Thermoplasmatota archaeon]MDP7263986.1 carbohydrate kinase family protein [Candidatus Thermoplasmatota archaeon]
MKKKTVTGNSRTNTDLLVIGNIVCDVIASIKPGTHPWGTLSHVGEPITVSVGGNGSIAAMAAAKLGMNVKITGKIGNDMFADFVISEMRKGGVNCDLVERLDGPGSATFVLTDPSKDRTFFHHAGPNEYLRDLDGIIDDDLLEGFDALLVTSYFLLPGLDGPVAMDIMKRARTKGIKKFLDVSWDESGKWKLDEVLEHVDYFICNLDEGRGITGCEDVHEISEDLLARGAPAVIIKMGNMGVFVADNSIRKHIPVNEVVTKETTGCGDIFNAAFIQGILEKKTLVESARFASAAGAYAAQFLGTVNSLPTINDIRRQLAE